MILSRRDFIKLAIPAAGVLALSGSRVFATNAPVGSADGKKNAVLYDSSKCIGCRNCESACRMENNLHQASSPTELSPACWTFIQSQQDTSSNRLRLKRQCMHCIEASCVAVCPTGAAAHHGVSVVIDQSWCIGCGYCEESCPFGVPHREAEGGTVKKCTLCFQRTSQGLPPACVSMCKSGALTYGKRADILSAGATAVNTLVKSNYPEANLYGAAELGGLSVLYVLLNPPTTYGLPAQPQQATKNSVFHWLSGSTAAGALVLPFWWFFQRSKKKSEKETVREGGVE